MNARSRPVRVALAWLPALLYTLLIWWLSAQPLSIELIEKVPLRDKGVHFLEYGALGFFLAVAVATTWPGRGLAGTLVAVCMTSALGLLDELHQAFVPGRSSDLVDLLADTLGAICGAMLHVGLARLLHARRRGPSGPAAEP